MDRFLVRQAGANVCGQVPLWQVGAKHLESFFTRNRMYAPDASPLHVDGGFPCDDLDLFVSEAIEFVDEVVDFAVGDVDLAMEQVLL